MKITVLGCGAIGQLWLCHLHQQGHDVQGWLHQPAPSFTSKVITLAGEILSYHFPANNAAHLAQSDLLLVALKAWQTAPALNTLLPLIAPNCTILLIHNGMGVEDELPPIQQPLLRAITTQAACYNHDSVVHIAAGLTQIGALNRQAHSSSYLAKILHQALPNVIWEQQILNACWQKLAINCIINPLTVVYNCHNGDLLHHRAQIESLFKEITGVMEKAAIPFSFEELHNNVIDVITHTAKNISSMLQDVRAQRHTEIDYITGYLLQYAQRYHQDIPENRRLFNLIKQKEKSYEHISSAMHRPR